MRKYLLKYNFIFIFLGKNQMATTNPISGQSGIKENVFIVLGLIILLIKNNY